MTLDRFQKKFGLTMRERQVAALLASGCSLKEIENSLGVARRTVSFHLAHLRKKISAPSMRVAAARISATLKTCPLL
jgi:DNA-binding CsgD family transcriptional regulator